MMNAAISESLVVSSENMGDVLGKESKEVSSSENQDIVIERESADGADNVNIRTENLVEELKKVEK